MPRSYFTGPRLLLLCCAATASLTLTACSSGSQNDRKEYAVPTDLCGTALPSDDLAPLLPGGDKISSSRTALQGYSVCYLSVDGKKVLSSLAQRVEAGTTVTDVADSTYGLKADSDRTETAVAVVSDEAAVAQVSCAQPRNDGQLVFTTLRELDRTADPADLKKAVTAFAKSVASSTELCTENDS